MPYNSVIDRNNAGPLIPEEVNPEVLKEVAEQTPILRLARKLPNMSRNQKRIPVMSALATAYFVNGATGLKQTTEVNWENKYIDAEELAVIVPIPDQVLDDTDYDIWGECKQSITEAFGLAIFQAVAYGTNIPAAWTTNLGAAGLSAVCAAATPSQVLSAAAYTDLYEAILGETGAHTKGVFMAVEGHGFGVTGNIAHMSMKGMMRNLRDTTGQPILRTGMQDATRYELDGTPIYFPTDGSVVSGSSLLISGDWSKLVYAMRQDITWKLLDQAVIQDAGGNIVYNLAQQDMVALRGVMRLGFALPNPINRMEATAANRCPFSILTA